MTDPILTPSDPPVPPPAAVDPRCPRWVRVALVTSLAANLLIAGLVGGNLLAHRRDRPPGPDSGIGAIAEAMSRSDRRALREDFLSRRGELTDKRAAGLADLQALVAALRAEPFDPAAVRTVFDRQLQRAQEGLGVGQAALMNRFTAMSAAERAAFADRLEQVLSRPRDRDRGGDRPDDAEGDGTP